MSEPGTLREVVQDFTVGFDSSLMQPVTQLYSVHKGVLVAEAGREADRAQLEAKRASVEHLRVVRAMVGRRSSQLVRGKLRDLVLDLVREDVAGLMPSGPRRDGTSTSKKVPARKAIWSLEARPPTTAEQADAIFQVLAAPVLAAGAPARSAR